MHYGTRNAISNTAKEKEEEGEKNRVPFQPNGTNPLYRRKGSLNGPFQGNRKRREKAFWLSPAFFHDKGSLSHKVLPHAKIFFPVSLHLSPKMYTELAQKIAAKEMCLCFPIFFVHRKGRIHQDFSLECIVCVRRRKKNIFMCTRKKLLLVLFWRKWKQMQILHLCIPMHSVSLF